MILQYPWGWVKKIRRVSRRRELGRIVSCVALSRFHASRGNAYQATRWAQALCLHTERHRGDSVPAVDCENPKVPSRQPGQSIQMRQQQNLATGFGFSVKAGVGGNECRTWGIQGNGVIQRVKQVMPVTPCEVDCG